jgi:hypothetical protein
MAFQEHLADNAICAVAHIAFNVATVKKNPLKQLFSTYTGKKNGDISNQDLSAEKGGFLSQELSRDNAYFHRQILAGEIHVFLHVFVLKITVLMGFLSQSVSKRNVSCDSGDITNRRLSRYIGEISGARQWTHCGISTCNYCQQSKVK